MTVRTGPFSQTFVALSHKHPPSSRAWLARQFRDPYVRARLSNPSHYRSRAAFKLVELDSRWGFLGGRDVRTVVDLGAAPGGWAQVVAGKMGWGDWEIDERVDLGAEKEVKEEEVTGASGFGLSGEKKAVLRREKVEKSKGKQREWSLSTAAGVDSAKGLEPDPYDELLQDVRAVTSSAVATAGPKPRVGRGTIIAVDLLKMEPIAGVQTLQMDFLAPHADEYIAALLASATPAPPFRPRKHKGKRGPRNAATVEGGHEGEGAASAGATAGTGEAVRGKADVILSDMAANFTGNGTADMEASLTICKSVFAFACRHLRTAESMGRRRGGALVMKHFMHPQSTRFMKEVLEPNFNIVAFDKPPSSRSESREGYWVCLGWKGPPAGYLSA